jgi:hypothetical protein
MREVGALLDAKAVNGGRSARNHLLCLAQTNDIPTRRVDKVLGIVGLSDVAGKQSKGFSLGISQRLGIAEACRDPGVAGAGIHGADHRQCGLPRGGARGAAAGAAGKRRHDMAAVTARPGAVPAQQRAGFAGSLRPELTKMRSVRSTYWSQVLLVLASLPWSVAF